MSKIMDELRARYDRQTPRKAVRELVVRKMVSPVRKPKPKHMSYDTALSILRQPVSSPHPRSKHRDVEGLEWTIFEETEVLRLGHSNYVAVPDERHTFTIYRIEPRTSVRFRLKAKELLGVIERLIQRDEDRVAMERKLRQRKETEEAEEERRREDQPGFYVTPGEEDPDDRENLLPIGPFWRFGLAGPRYSPEDLNDSHLGDDDVEDWALEAWKAEQEKPADKWQPVTIIEARNLREAKAGKGHVWWEDGVFKGPPMDPRQAGWGW